MALRYHNASSSLWRFSSSVSSTVRNPYTFTGPYGVPSSSTLRYFTLLSTTTPPEAKRSSTSATASASSPSTVRDTSSHLASPTQHILQQVHKAFLLGF